MLKCCSILSLGFYMEPTVFTDVEDHMYIAQEESFGPVMVISKFKNGYVLLLLLLETLFSHFHPKWRSDSIYSILLNLVRPIWIPSSIQWNVLVKFVW